MKDETVKYIHFIVAFLLQVSSARSRLAKMNPNSFAGGFYAFLETFELVLLVILKKTRHPHFPFRYLGLGSEAHHFLQVHNQPPVVQGLLLRFIEILI